VVNGDFAAGSTGWKFYTNGTGGFGVVGGEARIQSTAPGTNVQLFQANVAVQGGTAYRLRLRARSTSGADAALRLQQHVSPYASYGLSRTLNLTTEMQEFVVVFDTTAGDKTDGRLMLQLGAYDLANSQYYFDDVFLERLDDCPYCGDGRVGFGEDCDDGNRVDGDDCPGDCRLNSCAGGPVPVNGVTVVPGGTTTVTWPAQGSGVVYDVVAGNVSDLAVYDGVLATTCVASTEATIAVDAAGVVAQGQARYYLVRPRNSCGDGTFGTASHGQERTPADTCD
jgi:cysteine-rich repeat protein